MDTSVKLIKAIIEQSDRNVILNYNKDLESQIATALVTQDNHVLSSLSDTCKRVGMIADDKFEHAKGGDIWFSLGRIIAAIHQHPRELQLLKAIHPRSLEGKVFRTLINTGKGKASQIAPSLSKKSGTIVDERDVELVLNSLSNLNLIVCNSNEPDENTDYMLSDMGRYLALTYISEEIAKHQ